MALISLHEISKQYDYTPILTDVSLHLNENERIAIVGKNGSGKSTLLKIVAGNLELDGGERVAMQGIEIKMLPQKPTFAHDMRVRDAIESELAGLKRAKCEWEEISTRLASESENRELLTRHSELTTFLEHHGAWDLDSKVERIMVEFELKEFENSLVNLLSGGEQKRVALAGLLLQKPDILLLDEPTNHLDVQMVEFLEELLNRENFTLLFISHDRYFIDHIATRTVEIEDSHLRSFDGGYGSYLRQKEELLSAMTREHEVLLKLLKAEEEWLRRGVKARLKRNEGRKQRVLAMREEAKKNPGVIRKMRLELEREKKHFNQEDGVNRKKMLFELKNLSLKMGEKVLVDSFSTRILQKDKIAIVGKNGSGKSTLLKALLGTLSVKIGTIERGDVRVGYFDQHRAMLDDSKNLLETFCPFGGDRVEVRGKSIHVYGYLKNFLFPREFLDKKIGVLSGGEKNRVALALLFTKEYDCLILDEPTNDLDIPTINILEEYLRSFEGAIIFVSHDRYFVDKIAQKLLIFKGGGIIEESYLSYSEYLDVERELREYSVIEREEKSPKIEQESPKKVTKLSYKEQRLLELLPSEIEKLEVKIKEIEYRLYNPGDYGVSDLSALSSEYDRMKYECEEKLEQYIELESKREELERG
ncbi:MAG: ribosomal protection-like ABC-F family protein [Wolinella sp.]